MGETARKNIIVHVKKVKIWSLRLINRNENIRFSSNSVEDLNCATAKTSWNLEK